MNCVLSSKSETYPQSIHNPSTSFFYVVNMLSTDFSHLITIYQHPS